MKTIQFKAARLGISAVLGATLLAPTMAHAANLTGAGSTFVYPIMSKWADAYKGAQVNYQSIGSGGGIQQFKNGTVDFGASDAPLSNSDLKTMPSSTVQFPVTSGAVVLAYNGLPRGLKLSGDVIAALFLGKITRWNDSRIAELNPGMNLPSKYVTIAHRSDGSGTTFIFTDYLTTVNNTWAGQVGKGKSVAWPVGLGGKGNEGVAGIVKSTSGSIGYVELAYATQNKLAFASVRNRSDKFVTPTVSSVTSAIQASSKALQRDIRSHIVNAPGAASYPISGMVYVMLSKKHANPAKGQALKGFFNWVLTGGQTYSRGLLYAPLPRAIVSVGQAKLRSMK